MSATAGTTTLEVPIPLRERIAQHKAHPRQPYHEVIAAAMDALDGRRRGPGLDPLVAKHRHALRRSAKRNRITRIWLIGSRARGDARPDSDVDLLIDTAPGATLFDTTEFYLDAKDILGVEVDVAELRALKPDFKRRILPEASVI